MQRTQDIYNTILKKISANQRQVAVLIDPDEYSEQNLNKLFSRDISNKIDYIFVGGSIIFSDIGKCIDNIKRYSNKPVIVFPGHSTHISNNADALLLLSLISGRNPEMLIGNHIIAAPKLKQSGLEIISTGYILIENGKTSSVQYMSNTQPIPREKVDIAVATAIAGELLGLKMIYLEAGSGAANPVKNKMIESIKSNISIPLLVGGGLKTATDINSKFNAGADIVVIGNAIENNPEILSELLKFDK
ncbi:MAG TPA: geranylgeranylglyceryl/heptaprenylglyceryl phosphate synthase [Bacteroidales bacterium]|jgi:putative glycerol-1-phosphate prenyltransferase|nr:geranylgeranylglyceryl/heptaprenylglyceryl phosphate synthase [Bacteroidales bacterium]MDD4236028.1 geranylgeranylglyceryl/heptaprenylglyceryl phosphate synthase [Bacteroidales bacterium]MDY0159761.1 geranylgeranylglyceryl/heptaprenylglyceryl phosphate synthase [Bacteroidales bacterium]HRW20953.1 geranylgeranylglyceryl/heptaprenylglyceryl phosphate synthase [Bacteroidales bacterium]HXK82182.1 geranylgeranylglyceryl/heptaprenylglyceryl phosphate synthase [Bacteroidales bacterium]